MTTLTNIVRLGLSAVILLCLIGLLVWLVDAERRRRERAYRYRIRTRLERAAERGDSWASAWAERRDELADEGHVVSPNVRVLPAQRGGR